MSSTMDGIPGDVLAILGARSATDVQIRKSPATWSRYTFEAALSSAPGHVLPIDEPTAHVLLANGALSV